MQQSVYDYFSRAMRRPALDLTGHTGETLYDVDGASAVFSVECVNRCIAVANYRCTTCVTLVALCEHLSETIRGQEAACALSFTSSDLLAMHREIPPERRGRAGLAVQSMQSAVRQAFKEDFN